VDLYTVQKVGQSGVIQLGTIFRLQVLPFEAKPGGVCQLDITCFSPFLLAVPNGVWAVIATYKLPEQSPTLLLRQLTQIYEYTHISRLLYAYCTPVTATVIMGIIKGRDVSFTSGTR
jgi:hypothetical protein